MNDIAIAAIMLVIGFLGGVMAGIVVIVAVASRREDREYSLTGDAPDATCRGARRLTGMALQGSRFPGIRSAQACEEHDDDGPSWPGGGFRG